MFFIFVLQTRKLSDYSLSYAFNIINICYLMYIFIDYNSTGVDIYYYYKLKRVHKYLGIIMTFVVYLIKYLLINKFKLALYIKSLE